MFSSRIRRILLTVACAASTTQYGMLLIFGLQAGDLGKHYALTATEVDSLFVSMNFGACALGFIAGFCIDLMGSGRALFLGTALGLLSVLFQLNWPHSFPSFVSTTEGLSVCYGLFGLCASFFNIVGQCIPISVCDHKDIGKVSAVIQASISLGITLQSAVYASLQASWVDPVNPWLVYTASSALVFGGLVVVLIAACEDLLQASDTSKSAGPLTDPGSPHENNSFIASKDAEFEPFREHAPLCELLCSMRFVHMVFLFFVSMGFGFSFLDIFPQIATDAGMDSSYLSMMFGIVNALARVFACCSLDCTRRHWLGGVYSYILGSLAALTFAMLLLIVPAEATAEQICLANVFVSVGYGVILSISPAALRLMFGTERLSSILGLLWVLVAISVPLWVKIGVKRDHCLGAASCYRPYCIVALLAFVAAGIFTVVAAAVSVRWRRFSPKTDSLDVRLLAVEPNCSKGCVLASQRNGQSLNI
eukprot:TRINITY_DN77840_c0_g1_i1.p1 TRINITY_DN77840_c0_g1~~TRINITY_DN77840_c0_g1_i1.p1  ORF type:complete len:478 (-),score=53.24 TRINITY_DN77840_c0_g1_i1:22-1455(-)